MNQGYLIFFCKIYKYSFILATQVNFATYNYIGVGTGEEGGIVKMHGDRNSPHRTLFYTMRPTVKLCTVIRDKNRACDPQIEQHLAYDDVNQNYSVYRCGHSVITNMLFMISINLRF